MRVFVDLPQFSGEWKNVAEFSSKEDALKYVKEHFGADNSGSVCLLTEMEEEEEEEEEEE